ncbi:TIGR03749 family integrating conjugative element protein [Pseudomonas borbori]|uniref:Integrating conjugative element protein, PFL_4704 family n=1 Tax=Pseudomonas borbori TaxID=289003 RepID=A0A1I5WIZ4_9PSED|nr:TIGR03749 family integrating conjugative element protein [Pseudomonas borbori]SFQ19538.1 integrating conjugative element protein, PFL_4704 family [Pseudomonas borbori]
MKRNINIGAAIVLGLISVSIHAVELMRWERLPLPVALVIGHERVVFLDEDVRVGLPTALAGKLRVQSTGATLYLLASEAIAPSRLQLQSVTTGQIILLDIAASPGERALEPVRIIRGDPSQTTDESPASAPSATPIPVALTRYAAQSLYAPLRTVEALPGLRRVPLRLTGELPTLLPTENVASMPIAAWQLGDYWVTAVKLRNRGTNRVLLDPRRLQARLFAATFQHANLGSVGSAEDTSVAYLVTRDSGLERAVLLAPVSTGDDDDEG